MIQEQEKKYFSKKNQHSQQPHGGRRFGRQRKTEREKPEFEQKILDLARVTRVTSGGKRMSFRATLVIGDRKGRVGLGIAKGADVALAVDKAYRQAKKKIFSVPIFRETIPHEKRQKFGAAKILLKPAPKGTGLKAGGAVRIILELAGVPNAVSKIYGGSNNKINVAKATCQALKNFLPFEKKEKKQEEEKQQVVLG